MPNKKWMVTGVVAVAAVITFIAMRGPKMGNQDTPGTIGAANRYQSEQIAPGDVTIDNAQVATFIQSDTFRKLATDESFREAAKSESFNRFIQADGLREASAKVDVAAVMRDASFRELLKSDDFARSLDQSRLQEALKSADLAKLSEGGKLQELLKSDALRELAARQDFQRLADAAARQDARSIADLAKLADAGLKSADSYKALEGSRAFQESLKSGFMGLFRTAEGAKFATEGLRTLADNKSFTEAARVEGFRSFVEGMRAEDLGAVRELAANKDMLTVLASDSYREAAARAEMGAIADAGLPRDALARVSE